MRKVVARTFLSLDGVMEAPEKWQLPNDLVGEDAGGYVFEASGSSRLVNGLARPRGRAVVS